MSQSQAISMGTFTYREAQKSDIPSMAAIRAAEWETEAYWATRIGNYLDGDLHPQQALKPRIGYVALQGDSLIGFIAGHLTRRFNCDGELEWINVTPAYRGSGVAAELLRLLAEWFVNKKALRICIDVQPTNTAARKFYQRHGATALNKHWRVWNDISGVLANGKRV